MPLNFTKVMKKMDKISDELYLRSYLISREFIFGVLSLWKVYINKKRAHPSINIEGWALFLFRKN